MKTTKLFLLIFPALLLAACNKQTVKPPVAEKIPHEVFDGRIDNYYWMRLSDEQKSAETSDEHTLKVLDYLNGENEYTTAVMKHNEGLQQTLFDELTGRIKQDDESVPYLDNGYYYYTRYSEGKEYPVHCRKKGSLDAPEEIILDVNMLAEGKDYCSVSQIRVSRDNKMVAYGVDFVSRRRYTIHVLDLESGRLLPDMIESTTGNLVWAADNITLFYTSRDFETLRADRVMKHKLGSPASWRSVKNTGCCR